MSKIGKKPIVVPQGVEVKIQDGVLEVKGKEGSLKLPVLEYISTEIKDGQISLKATASHKQARANWGTLAALLKNAIVGVSQGFTKALELEGVGFRASLEGATLVLTVGFSHPVKFTPPAGIKITTEKNTIKVFGIDRALVGQVAAEIRKIKEPEPYKGKGLHYVGEVIRRKAGKKVAGAGTAGAAA